MFGKVLIVDDHVSINTALGKLLKEADVDQIDQALYCDDAYLKIKKGQLDKKPYDLIVTDLQFKQDHRDRSLTSGEDLIKKLRSENPSIPIIVYSQEDHSYIVRKLIQQHRVNAYVWKSRDSEKEFPLALQKIQSGEVFVSKRFERVFSKNSPLEITEYDLNLMGQLAEGKSQSEISTLFKQNSIHPNSISSIEKRLNTLKIQFTAKNTTHLVSIMKDHKFI